MKTCSRCGLLKSSYYPDKRAKDGLYSHCTECEKVSKASRQAKSRQYHKEYYQANKLILSERSRAYQAQNVGRMREYRAKWRKDNLEHCAALRAKARAAKKSAAPKWLSAAHLAEITQIYLNCPAGNEIDHIIPLQGKTVCGLHVPWNLQYLSVLENRRKGNKVA